MYGRRSVDFAAVGKRDLAVVAGVLVGLADDDPDVLVAERRHARRVLVAVGEQLEQAGGDARLDDADPDAVADRDEPVALGQELDRVAGVHLGELARVGQLDQHGEAGLAGLLDEDADRRLAAGPGRHGRARRPRRAGCAGGRCSARRCGWSGRGRARSGSARAPRRAGRAPRATWRAGSRPRRPGPSRGCAGSSRRRAAQSAAVACATACSDELALQADLAGRGRFVGLDFWEGHGDGSSFRACANGAMKDALVRKVFIASPARTVHPAWVASRASRARSGPPGEGVPGDARLGILPRSASPRSTRPRIRPVSMPWRTSQGIGRRWAGNPRFDGRRQRE